MAGDRYSEDEEAGDIAQQVRRRYPVSQAMVRSMSHLKVDLHCAPEERSHS
jgi:hypothetical protein